MTDSLVTRFTHALNSPIRNRCAELTVLIDRYSSKDLQNVFPTLMESIFGTSGGLSWGLRTITQNSGPNDFTTLHHFLGPLGPVFRLIYKLLTETQVKYEYSVTHLPCKVRQIFENCKVPPFYTDLLNIETQSRKVHSLSLNPFDYYMFHFAYHLTNPWQQRVTNTWIAWNTVYYVLCCDYMLHFLPTDPNVVILPQLIYFTGKNPTIIPPQSVTNRPQCTSKLFRTHVLQQTAADISTLHQPMQQHPRSEIWRSETVVQVFIDIWLHNDQLNTVDTSFNLQSRVNELPSGEYIRIIRVFVKQLHAFSASSRHDTTPLGELKKIIQPMLQGPMYAFLRHLVYRWPLDGSFRLVLELWLSFIQPWRYLGENQVKNPENENDDPHGPPARFVDQQYIGFIADNLLAYTVIFQQLLPRFSRIDLASPKNALMLFRVCKVFGQPNLVPMIREIETCVENLNHSPTHSYTASGSPTLPPLSPTSCWSTNTSLNPQINLPHSNFQSGNTSSSGVKNVSATDSLPFGTANYQSPRMNVLTNKWAAIVRHRIYEWEGPEFCYKPMFTQKAAPEVYQLYGQIVQAEQTANGIVQQRVEEQRAQYSASFSAFFKALLYFEDCSNDEFTLEERKKVPVFLNTGKRHLVDIFRLEGENAAPVPGPAETTTPHSQEPTTSSFNTSIPTNFDMTPTGARKRARSLKYQGDPDLHPIRSSENAFLVRVLYQLANKLNETYPVQLRNLYYRDDFIGRLSRQVLNPPLLTHSYDKSIRGFSPRVQKMLPPRISLRYFASHSFLAYVLIGFLLIKYLGYGLFSFIFIILIFCSLFILLKALLDFRSPNAESSSSDFDEYNDVSFY